MMSSEIPADGLNPRLAELFTSMFQSGQSEARGVAECLNCIAENGEGQESDEHMLACAEEMLASVQQVINLLKPPPKPADDPYKALMIEATKAADRLDARNAVTRHAAEDNTVALRMAIANLYNHLRDNVSNSGEPLELHRFPNRKMSLADMCYKKAAGGKDGELEFDTPTVVRYSDDGGAYVIGWSWVDDDDVELPKPFSCNLFAQDEHGGRTTVGTDVFLAADEDHARERMIERHWDERLTAASCSPVVTFNDLQLPTFSFTLKGDDNIGLDPIQVEARTREEALEILNMIRPMDEIEEDEEDDVS